MSRVEVRLDWGDAETPLGMLGEVGRRIYFEFAESFAAAPLPVSPFKLPVRPGLIEHADADFAEMFGIFSDSLPDGWGRLLMDREFRSQGRNPARVSVLERLAYIGTRGMGALTYHPPAFDPDEELGVDLGELAAQAERILEGSAEEVLPALRVAGGSPGGARPKVLVGVSDDGAAISGTADIPPGFRHFIVKFAAREDPDDIGAIEAAYALMAGQAGIDMPFTRLFQATNGDRYFGAERFDRRGNLRVHVHTLSGLLHASHRYPSLDYEGFLKATFVLTRHVRQVEQAFRRMVFNVLAHNRDDHTRNFAYLMERDGSWSLAPAYDLVFSAGPGGQHTMAVAGEADNISDQHMLKAGEDADIPPRQASQIIAEVREAVQQWPRFARATDVSAASRQRIGRVIAPAARRR